METAQPPVIPHKSPKGGKFVRKSAFAKRRILIDREIRIAYLLRDIYSISEELFRQLETQLTMYELNRFLARFFKLYKQHEVALLEPKKYLFSIDDLVSYFIRSGVKKPKKSNNIFFYEILKYIHYLEEKGRLTLPHNPLDQKTVMLTLEQMKAIANAFLPGGKGYWHFQDEDTRPQLVKENELNPV